MTSEILQKNAFVNYTSLLPPLDVVIHVISHISAIEKKIVRDPFVLVAHTFSKKDVSMVLVALLSCVKFALIIATAILLHDASKLLSKLKPNFKAPEWYKNENRKRMGPAICILVATLIL